MEKRRSAGAKLGVYPFQLKSPAMCGAVAVTYIKTKQNLKSRHVPDYEIQSDAMYFSKTFQRSKTKALFIKWRSVVTGRRITLKDKVF